MVELCTTNSNTDDESIISKFENIVKEFFRPEKDASFRKRILK